MPTDTPYTYVRGRYNFPAFIENKEWDKWIPYYTFAYNINTIYRLKLWAIWMIIRKVPYLPYKKIKESKTQYHPVKHIQELKRKLKKPEDSYN